MFMDVTPQHDVSQNTATPATNGQLFCWLLLESVSLKITFTSWSWVIGGHEFFAVEMLLVEMWLSPAA